MAKTKLSPWYIYTGKEGNRHSTGKHMTQPYKDRLTRNGISYSDYKQGKSVTIARGHGESPENPEAARKHPERYPNYKHPIRAIVQNGDQAEIVEIGGLTKPQRVVVAKHWNAVFDYLSGQGSINRPVPQPWKKRTLESFKNVTYQGYTLETRKGAIDQLALITDLLFEDFYPKVK